MSRSKHHQNLDNGVTHKHILCAFSVASILTGLFWLVQPSTVNKIKLDSPSTEAFYKAACKKAGFNTKKQGLVVITDDKGNYKDFTKCVSGGASSMNSFSSDNGTIRYVSMPKPF